jgi:hypothetical protein
MITGRPIQSDSDDSSEDDEVIAQTTDANRNRGKSDGWFFCKVFMGIIVGVAIICLALFNFNSNGQPLPPNT